MSSLRNRVLIKIFVSDPRPDITAALLHVFLEIAGWKMSQCYGAQFWKMMQLMNTEYIKKIEKVCQQVKLIHSPNYLVNSRDFSGHCR